MILFLQRKKNHSYSGGDGLEGETQQESRTKTQLGSCWGADENERVVDGVPRATTIIFVRR